MHLQLFLITKKKVIGEHVFTGRCRVVEESTRVWIRLEDRVSGELFAESPLDESGK